MKKTTLSNCRALRLLATALLLLTVSVSANAWDFYVKNEDGVTIYYNKSGSNATVTHSGGYTGAYNSYSGTVVIPETVTYDGITYTVTSIGSYAFRASTGLTSVTIPNSVTTIAREAFDGCTGLTEITIPNSVTSISGGAFGGCSGLTKFEVAEGNEYYCSVDGVLYSKDMTTLVLFPLASPLLPSFAIPESVTTISSSAFDGCTGLTEITIPNSVTTIGASSFYNCSKLTEIAIPGSVTSIGNDAFYGCSGLWSISNTSKTQSTCTMRITSNISGAECGVYYNYSFHSVDDDGYCTITGLSPNTSYSFYFGIMLSNDRSRHGGSISVTTTEINPQITQISLTPESFTATGSYTAGDANVTATGFTGYTSDGATLYLTNLEPKTQYTVEYYVTASGKKFTASTKFTTPAVEFTTLPAKATSNTVALLGATTNLSDDAVGAGFEWRRNDAPSTMPSNQAECPVIDGELTGTLNGLSATTYYDFRPYYTSQGGTTYYGDWITFITADAYVYFEPTVRTYSATSVGSSSATVKAYAVAGSDNITSQGFEYWQGGPSSAMNVRRASTTDENGVTRVEVSGQWMTATLEDLEPSTTYSYRAYVTTAVGTTYGETMSFTTDVPTGIEGTRLTEDAEVYEIARYTLDGKKISQPVRGINIVRYSDGTSKKVLVK